MTPFEWVAVAVITILSSSRITRLLTYDKFPPVRWLRHRYIGFTGSRERLASWTLLAKCPFCMGPWVTAAVVAWGYCTDWHDPWWLFNGVMGASYLAATYMIHDGDDSHDEDDD